MAKDDKETLKRRIQEFLEKQQLFDNNQKIRVVCDKGNLYFILYCADLAVDVAGFGETIEGAYNDFVDNWKMYEHRLSVAEF